MLPIVNDMDAASIITTTIESFFNQYTIKSEKGDGVDAVLCRYFNFRLKHLPPVKRQLNISKELAGKITAHIHKAGILDIFSKTALGEDINPYQSKASFNADFHDRLFNDWVFTTCT